MARKEKGTHVNVSMKKLVHEKAKRIQADEKLATISDAIDKMILDDEFRSNLASNARNRAKIFSKVEIPYDEVK